MSVRKILQATKHIYKMEDWVKKRIFIEVRFLAIILMCYTAFYFILATLINEEPGVTTFLETMVVFVLVSYLIRFVFVVITHLK